MRFLDVLAIHHGVQVALRLLFYGPDDRGVRVAEVGDPDPGEQIEIFPTVFVHHDAAVRAFDLDAQRFG